MAKGDYVKTYSGALASGIASTINRSLGQGASVSRAIQTVMERLPSLPANLAALLVINTNRQYENALVAARERQAVTPPRTVQLETVALPAQHRYLTEAIAVTADGERTPFFSMYKDSETPLSDAELFALLADKLGPLVDRADINYPELYDVLEEEPTIEYRVVSHQERIGA